jgi:hypothetical protein
LVEHCTENAGVGGSIPPLGTTLTFFKKYLCAVLSHGPGQTIRLMRDTAKLMNFEYLFASQATGLAPCLGCDAITVLIPGKIHD